MKKKKFLVIKVILIVIISLLIGFGVFSWNSKMTGKAVPMPFGFGLAEVVSGSMYPTIDVGDVVMIVPQDEYEVEDIVAFKDPIGIVTHRIIEDNGDGTFTTKGDNPDNSVDTLPLRREYIIGKVVKIIPGVGAVVNIIQSPIVIALLIMIIALLLYLATKKEKAHDNAELAKIKSEIDALKNDDALLDDIQAQIDALKREAEERNKKQ